MNKPELYNTSNKMPKMVSISALTQYLNIIKWKKTEDTAIDLGCGDGSLTALIKNFSLTSYKNFVACDINENMINFAKKHYADEDISFTVMDIVGAVPEDMKGTFNHVFSFYALHWVKDQAKAFKNIYDLMSNDGDCFMTFAASAAVYSVYAELAHHPKWKSWLKHVDIIIGPYHNMKDPENEVIKIMEKSGFKNPEVSCKKVTNVYNSALALKNFVQSVEPFNMPMEVFDEFIEDYITVANEIGAIRVEYKDNLEKILTEDHILVVYASK